MTPDTAKIFLTLLGGKISTVSSTQVGCHCIYAPWFHEGGVDNHPSGFLYIGVVHSLKYRCYSCERGGTPDQVYHEIKYLNEAHPKIELQKKKILDIIAGVGDTEDDFDFPDFDSELNKNTEVELYPFSESWWKSFPSAVYHPYVEERGIDPITANTIDARLDFVSGRVLFPVRDWEGVLMGAHGRTYCDATLRYYAYPKDGAIGGQRNPSVWMGEHHVNLEQPIILTEGQFDYAKVFPFYQNVLCGMTTQFSMNKMKRLKGAVELLTIFDNGKGGDKGRNRIETYFHSIPVQHVLVPEEYGDLGDCPDDIVYELLNNIA